MHFAIPGSKRSELAVKQDNITPVVENNLQQNDQKGPRIELSKPFYAPGVILYENCNMTLSSYTDKRTKLVLKEESHTPSSTRFPELDK